MTSHADELRKKIKKDSFVEDNFYLRLHRATSWLKAAEEHSSNSDIQFICLWISFNSCYAVDNFFDTKNLKRIKESESLNTFLIKLISCDQNGKIYSLIWKRFSSEIRLILDNKFLFKPFWDFHRGDNVDYESQLNRSNKIALECLGKGDVVGILNIVLERLYTLRNQIFHGGATYKGRLNRRQIKDVTQMLIGLLPIVVELMIDNEEKSWGLSYYPVIIEP